MLPVRPMSEIRENATIDAWVQAFARSGRQVNAPHESDAEIIELPGDDERCLAATIDTVAEEVASGLYRDHFTTGWVSVMASLSDLAAVGADPLGVVLSVSLPDNADEASLDRLRSGVESACRSLDVNVLGGDLNSSAPLSVTVCALGTVPRHDHLSRLGAVPGDGVFLTGGAGSGNALGLARAAGLDDVCFPEAGYRPTGRLAAGRALRGIASCAMDTSDGVLATLDQLSRLGGVGFELDVAPEDIVEERVAALCASLDVPVWMMLAGPHGEFELVFTVSESRASRAVEALREVGLAPLRLGRVRSETGIALAADSGKRVELDMAAVRNLPLTGRSLASYAEELRGLGKGWGLE